MVAQLIDWSSEPMDLDLFESNEHILETPFTEQAPRIVRPPFLEVIGGPYCGLAKSANGRASEFILTFVLQTQTGDLGGTILFHTARNGGATTQFQFQGALNREGLFVLHGSAAGNRIAVISGTASPDGNAVSGNYIVKSPGEPLDAGTFAATRPTARNQH